MNRLELAEEIRNDIRSGKTVYALAGAFGEFQGCDGYIKETIKPEEGGSFIRLYGCTYLIKGNFNHYRVHGIELSKSLISEIPRDLIAKSTTLTIAIGLLFLFARRRFIHYLDHYFDVIIRRGIRWHDLPLKEYNVMPKEVLRATKMAIIEQFGMDEGEVDRYQEVDHPIGYIYSYNVRMQKKQLGALLSRVSRFAALFLELDSAYRFRVQDAFGEIDAGAAHENPIKEFYRCLDILHDRDRPEGTGVRHKWRFLKIVFPILFFLSPGIKRFVSLCMIHVDPQKIKMDESDWYFCLKYRSYNFGGLSEEERFALREKIDAEKGHITDLV